MLRRIGFIGVGHLATFLTEGLARHGDGVEIVLSPRSAGKAAALAARFGATVAEHNQAVADAADVVVLSTRPAEAEAAARSVGFREGQTVVSVVSSLKCDVLRPAVAPATLVRAMPISCAAIGLSPTLVYPDHPEARELFELVGTVHVLTDESQFAAATGVAAFYGWLLALAGRTASWTERQGVPATVSRSLVLEVVRGAAGLGLARPDQELASMLEALATPGGLTDLGLQVLEERDGMEAWTQALDAVLRRLES